MKLPIVYTVFACLALLLPGCSGKNDRKELSGRSGQVMVMLDSINILDSLAKAVKTSDNERARAYAHQALALAKKSGSDQALATAFVIMGISYKNYNNDTSLVYNNRALELARKNQFAGTYSAALYNLANLYYEASDLKTAIMLTDSVLKISRMNGKFIWLSNAYNFLGNIKNDLNDTTGSQICYDSAINIGRNHGLRMQEGVAIASKAHYERDLNEKQKNYNWRSGC